MKARTFNVGDRWILASALEGQFVLFSVFSVPKGLNTEVTEAP